jgi:predicted nucleotidyltransferase
MLRCRRTRRIVEAIRRRSGYAWQVTELAIEMEPSSPLPHMVERIVEVLHPVQVWLFGSRARGEARPDSDWDFLAVLPDDAPEADLDIAAVWARLRDLRLLRVEVLTMTRGEFDEWKGALGTLAEIVASTGRVVYGG